MAKLGLSPWSPESVGARISSGCRGLSPSGRGGMPASPPLLPRLLFCLRVPHGCRRSGPAAFRSCPDGVGGGGRGDAKVMPGPSPPTPSCHAVGGSRWCWQPCSLPRVLLFPAPTLSFHNMKGQSLAGAFHCGFDGRRPPHPMLQRAAFGTRLSVGGCMGCSRSLPL